MKNLRWSSRNKKSDEKPKSSGNSGSSSSGFMQPSHRGSASSGSSYSKAGSQAKSVSSLYMSEGSSQSQRSLSSSSSKHDLKAVTDEESLDSLPTDSGTLTPVKVSNKDTASSIATTGTTYTGSVSGSDSSRHRQRHINDYISIESERTVQASNPPAVQLSPENFDSTIFKIGWLNKSHGPIHIPSSNPSSASSITSSRTNRESRLFTSDSGSTGNRLSSNYTQEYRLYKAQLKGCVLNLYKPGISNAKFFDPTLDPPSANSNQDDGSKSWDPRSSEGLPNLDLKDKTYFSKPPSAISSTHTKDTPSSATKSKDAAPSKPDITEIRYVSELYPHPELKIDKHDQIFSGTVESICHTILFSTSLQTKKILDLILMLPLIDDLKFFFQCFCLYGVSFTKNNEKLTNDSKQFHRISPAVDELMTQRLALVVKTVLDVFPGFLLDDMTFNHIIRLLDTISLHDDEISNTLKISIAESHNKLNELVSFTKVPVDQNILSQFSDVKEFLKLDNSVLADQIHAINLRFNKTWSPQTDYSLLYDSAYNKSYVDLNPLVFKNKSNVHYVGRLLAEHLFKKIDGLPLHPKERALVLTKWVDLGCTFEKTGDMVSWLAIATIICSIPVLRLSQTWQYISDQTLKIIFKDWVPTIAQLDRRELSYRTTNSVFILAPPNLNEKPIRDNVIPYFGDLAIHTNDLTEETMFRYLEKKIYRTKNAFQKWQQRLSSNGHSLEVPSPKQPEIQFYHYLNYHASQPKLDIEQLMEMSLRLEPPVLDKLDSAITSSRRSSLVSGNYLPILFNQLFDDYSIFSRTALIGAAGVQQSRNSYIQNNVDTKSGKAISVSVPLGKLNHGDKSIITGFDHIDVPTVRELSTKQSNKQMLLKSIRDVFSINMDLFHVLDDLTFKSVDDWDKKSRPTSAVIETPKRFSIQSSRDSQEVMNRLSTGVENLDFFKNIARDAASWDEALINVVLKSASLEKLFDVLILTSSVFSRLVSLNDISAYLKGHHDKYNDGTGSGLLDYGVVKLCMDNDLYTKTFFSTYKSFTTTVSLLENLAKRFIGAKSCAISIERLLGLEESKKKSVEPANQTTYKFPCWDVHDVKFEKSHYVYAAKIQIGTAEALLYMIKEHYSDFNDDLHNNKLLLDIIKIMDQEILDEWETRMALLHNQGEKSEEEKSMIVELENYHSKLKDILQRIKSSYQRQLYRPMGVSKHNRSILKILNSFTTISLEDLSRICHDSNSNDSMVSIFQNLKSDSTSETLKWMYSLDTLILSHLRLATIKEWMTVTQLLESFSYESLSSLFKYPQLQRSYSKIASGNAQVDDLEIMNIFTWIASLMNDKNELIFKRFPCSIQLIINLHISLTNFFVVQIAHFEKTYESRLETCSVILQILGFARWKNSSIDLFQPSQGLDSTISPHMPSFLESAIVNALLSPESRKFEMTWKAASEKLDPSASLKSINNVLSVVDSSIKNFIEYDGMSSNQKYLCPCPGWFINRLLEISQLVPNMSIENSKLINFDKRRFTLNLVLNYHQLLIGDVESVSTESSAFGGVLTHYILDPDHTFRAQARDVAAAETKLMKYQVRGLFNEILIEEMYKIKREQKKREHLIIQEKEVDKSRSLQQVMKQKSIDMQTSLLAQVQQQSMGPSSNHRSKRSSIVNSSRNSVVYTAGNAGNGVGRKIGGFFKRPFSIGGFSSSVSSNGLNSMLMTSVHQNGSIAPSDLPRVFKEDLQDQKSVLSLKTFDIKKCINVNNYSNDQSLRNCFKVVMENGQEHLIQTTNSQELSQWIKAITLSKRYSFHSRKFKGRTSNKVFGVPIEDICEREGTLIPTIVLKLLEEIELRGLDEVGLYRVPGSVGSINLLKNAFDDEGAVNSVFTLEDDRWFEINTIAGCFKLYLRELPESLFTNERLPDFINIISQLQKDQITEPVFESELRDALMCLPIYNYHMIKRIFQHLHKVHCHMDSNRMDANNLAIVFSMSFINQDDLANSMGPSLGLLQNLLQRFIRSPDVFFLTE